MKRRTFLEAGLGVFAVSSLTRAFGRESLDQSFEEATRLLEQSVTSGQVRAAAIDVRDGVHRQSQRFGAAATIDSSFLLGSISKPIAMTALMTLYDEGLFQLEDPVRQFLPEFRGEGRDRVTIRHLLTHTSGLPDQLPNNSALRASHAPLSEFVKETSRLSLAFTPGESYEYSSMGIMLGAEIAQRLSGVEIKQLVHDRVLKPLGMNHSALGVGSLKPEQMMQAQVEFGAVESGGGDPQSRKWDWNSPYWRELGAPWGGAQASAPDVGKFLEAFLEKDETILKPETARLMIRNHNPPPLASRGLAFDVDMRAYAAACTEASFGHTGSTGTIAWADPVLDRVCVVLTTLPARATDADQHPRQKASMIIGRS